jgi:hypothetical protein
MIGTERTHQLGLARAADARHLGPVRLCDLHRERADASPGTDDQNPLTRLHFPLVADSLQSRIARDSNGRRLLEAQPRRFGRQPVSVRKSVFGERAAAGAEHLITRLEAGHVRADRLHDPRHVESSYRVLRGHESVAGDPDRVGQTRHHMPDTLVDAGRLHPHEHVLVSDHRLVDLPKLQDVGRRPVLVLNDRPHDVECAEVVAASPARAKGVTLTIPR